jgi:hypothetical protein
MTARLLDATGAAWPDTGRRCTVCGWPVLLDETAHLMCELDPGSAQLCIDCRQPLPANAGTGVTCHLRCWQERKPAR